MNQDQKDFALLYFMIMFIAGIVFSLVLDEINYDNNKKIIFNVYEPELKGIEHGQGTEHDSEQIDDDIDIVETRINASAYTCFSKREHRVRAHGYLKGKPYRQTASGTVCKAYHSAAVDPRFIPLGTKIYHPGYKTWFVADDTGNGVKGNMIDFAVDNEETAFSFGRKDMLIAMIYPTKKLDNDSGTK